MEKINDVAILAVSAKCKVGTKNNHIQGIC